MLKNEIRSLICVLLTIAIVRALTLPPAWFETGAGLVVTAKRQKRSVSNSPLRNVDEHGRKLPYFLSLNNFKSLTLGPSSLLTSAFPLDLIISYNDTEGNANEFLARYASFSPILNVKLRSHYVILNCTACKPLNIEDVPHTKGKIVIVQRGDCAFVDKVTNLLEAKLDPHAIVIANNEPHRGLVTMYSTTFNDDDLVTVPILFMTLEDYSALKKLQVLDPELLVQTVSLDGLVGVMLLMAISPTLLILICYLIVKGLKHFRRRTLNARYKKIVQKLPVYIFSLNHLVPSINFQNYLNATYQAADVPLIPLSCDDLSINQPQDLNLSRSYFINGIDVHLLRNLELLFVDKDYFRTQKCSICLGHFVPLKSRVLVLKCKHVYHEECLSNWLVNFRRSCPLCNQNFNLLEQNEVYSHEPRSYNTFGTDFERDNPDYLQLSESEARDSLTFADHIQPFNSSTSSLPLPTRANPSIKHSASGSSERNFAESVQTNSSFVTSKSLLSDLLSGSFFTPQSTREANVEDDILCDLSIETITLP